MTGEGTRGMVEAMALPAPSARGRVQRSGYMGITGRDGREFRPSGEGGISPCGSGGGRPPTMVGRPHTWAWRKGPQTPYYTTPRGLPLGKFESPGMMGADDGRAPPLRDATNLTPPPPCTPSPLGGDPQKHLGCVRDTHLSWEGNP